MNLLSSRQQTDRRTLTSQQKREVYILHFALKRDSKWLPPFRDLCPLPLLPQSGGARTTAPALALIKRLGLRVICIGYCHKIGLLNSPSFPVSILVMCYGTARPYLQTYVRGLRRFVASSGVLRFSGRHEYCLLCIFKTVHGFYQVLKSFQTKFKLLVIALLLIFRDILFDR